ncbi:calcium uptake protein, mitochondrial-like [Phragmites australis]|uniref:calcium uptake protein, mitochondrial-like n=1 Tax=Phragmites australis TaxID=29695 RepID=UPI002D78707E|nr:calcium uptake protein, mitochondrial-like [Phragmites australis]
MASSPLPRAARLHRSAAGRLRSPPARAFSSAAGTGPSPGREGVLAAAAVALAGSGLGLWLLPPTLADSGEAAGGQISVAAAGAGTVEERETKGRFLFGDSFRRRVFFNYEKRIRLLSPPEKIFEYFATVRNPEGEVYMLPADLMRAVVPVFPPSESTIVRVGRLRGERSPGELHCAPSEFFMLFDTNSDGLISFAEYIFFVTLLSVPESNFTAAFKMFDVDHSGVIDREEFKKIMALMRSINRQGATHRDGLRVGLKVGQPVENGGLVEYFFGNDGNEPLHYDKFSKFLNELHDEIIRLEFSHYDVKSSKTIPAKDFAMSMVASADMNHINKLLDRVDDLVSEPDLKDLRITFEEFKSFADLRRRLQPLSMAIFSYGKVNGFLTKQDLKRAAYHVCEVDLTDRVVDIIFHVFDTNRDGHLSSEEFLRALQRRETDIRQPATPGPFGFLSCWFNCKKCSSLPQMVL